MEETNAVEVTVNTHANPTMESNHREPMSVADTAILESTLVAMVKIPCGVSKLKDLTHLQAMLDVRSVTYLTGEDQANEHLKSISCGVVGLDTEFVKREITGDEKTIDELTVMPSPFKKAARTALQYLESNREGYTPDWEHVGVCLIQLAYQHKVWVINLTRMRGLPRELKRILTSTYITKAGAGILSDAAVLWEDLRINLNNMVDVGLMTRLWHVDEHQDDSFTHMALDAAAKEVLGVSMDKTYQKGVEWKVGPHEAHITYAALDAVASLRLYEKLDPELRSANCRTDQTFSMGWYTFNSVMGEAMRSKLSVRNQNVPWSTKDCTWFAGGKFQGKHY
ncbi:ribonuclease H-like domain-containing protein [Mycena alexandri]|uniref:Ribonuclease H-like domain-containing protein n=1 Tax=Mycena alexandri TaxID=1745969 RepID=A0AAD6SNE3_9AGAR|nr:ribonuclease H-like domain-containing protein [Mycena alexandri]KAJ7028872.1 ribonuclease H-like domain-containing protein [Mycena alexandri]